MKEFMGRVMYPFRFSASSRLTSAGLFTHSSIFLTGMWHNFAVRILRGAVSFGVAALSPLPPLAFRDFKLALGLGLESFLCGERDEATPRPLRVGLRPISSSAVDRGVGGEKTD